MTYRLLLGIASANENDRGFDAVDRKYYALDRMFPALGYSFSYITKTAYTWKEPVENAVFTLDATEFFKKLEEANFFKELGEAAPAGVTRPVFLGSVSPSSFTRDKYVYRWEFSGKVPEEGIAAHFVVLFVPSSPSELATFVTEQVKARKDGVTPNEYLSVLAGYYARVLKKKTDAEKPFAQHYFEPVRVANGDLLFEKDPKLLESVLDKIRAITSAQN